MADKYTRVVVTCGVSIFSTSNRYREWVEAGDLLQFLPKASNPKSPDGLTEDEAIARLRRKCSQELAREPAEAEPARISAEYSAISALRNAGRLADRVQAVLIHTDTLGGRATGELLAALLRRDFGAVVELSEVHIDVDAQDELRYNLGDFMQKVALHLRDHDPRSTCFAPLGGYKVMTSLGYLAGAYFGFPTVYTHEDKQVLHEISAIPVRVPQNELRAIAPLMTRVGRGVAIAELSQKEQEHLRTHSWLFERDDEMVCVNAFGLFLMQDPDNAGLFGVALRVSEAVNTEFRSDGRLKFVLQQISVLGGKLAAESAEANLRHESRWKVSRPDRHLYKGASNGVLTFRCIYAFEDSTLQVFAVWTDHDKYEREFLNEWSNARPAVLDWS